MRGLVLSLIWLGVWLFGPLALAVALSPYYLFLYLPLMVVVGFQTKIAQECEFHCYPLTKKMRLRNSIHSLGERRSALNRNIENCEKKTVELRAYNQKYEADDLETSITEKKRRVAEIGDEIRLKEMEIRSLEARALKRTTY